MSPTLCKEVTAATAVLGHDFFEETEFKPYQRGKTARKVTHIALVGSTASGDTRYVLKYGSDIIGYFFNTITSTIQIDQMQDVQPVVDSRWASPDAPISLICDDIANTNPVMCMIYMVEAKPKAYKKRY